MSSSERVEATKVTYSGNVISTMPAISTACDSTFSQGRFSTISILHLALDVAELHHRQGDDDRHQDHRLRRGAAEVGRLYAVVVHLVDQDLRRAPGPALRGGVDH